MQRSVIIASIVLGCASLPVHGDAPKPVSTRTSQPYPAAKMTSYIFDEPRPMRAWTVAIDLTSPQVEIISTCPGDVEAPSETACLTTTQYAKSQDVEIAINASPFSPFRHRSGEGMDVVGFGACDGKVYSNPHQDFGALITMRDGRAAIVSPPIDASKLENLDEAIGGFRVLVAGGQNRADEAIAKVPKSFAGVNPRTAVGLSADGKTLYMIVIDGRNKGRSEGITLAELAEFGIFLGCHDLLNLDGGGSSTLVIKSPETQKFELINEPVGRKIVGTERLVANHIGVRIRPVTKAAE